MSQRQVAVACESTACLPSELVEQYAIQVVPVPFVLGSTTFRDGVDISPESFYARLAASSEPPKTSPPEPGAYLRAWQAAQGCEGLVQVTVAGRIGTFERSSQLAASLARERLPGVRIQILDSGSAAMGQGFVALAAARAADRGLDLESVVADAEKVATSIQLVVALDTLRYLARTSRIPQIASIVSSVLDLKPIIRVTDGDVKSVARVRSRARALDRLLQSVCDLSPPDKALHLAVHHARAPADAGRFLERLSERRSLAESYITEFTPVMGAYCGPGLVGAAFYPAAENEAV